MLLVSEYFSSLNSCLVLYLHFTGIVPYVDEVNLGTVTGIVGAGGNAGAVGFGMAFRQLDSNKAALTIMGATVLGSSILSLFIVIDGHDSVICRKRMAEDEEEGQQASSSRRRKN